MNVTSMTNKMRNFDWGRAWREGERLAIDQVRKGDSVDDRAVMWALLCEAATTSRLSYSAPPRTGLPQKSLMPDAPDDISMWQRISAYLKGDLEELPADEAAPPRPTAAQVTRSEMVLDVWHRSALTEKGDWTRMRKAVYLKACGVPDRKVRAVTGYSRQRIHVCKRQAMDDMLDLVRRLTNDTK